MDIQQMLRVDFKETVSEHCDINSAHKQTEISKKLLN